MLDNPQEDYTNVGHPVGRAELPAIPEVQARGCHRPIVTIDNVDAAYGQTKVLEDVSFDIHAGMTVAVVGESGSGKSTTARCITGLLPPATKGRILFSGEELPASFRARSKDQLRQAQMIYQMADTALNPNADLSEDV